MITTQLLLLLFLVKWLDGQYKEQRLVLQERFTTTYKEAYDDAVTEKIETDLSKFDMNVGDTTSSKYFNVKSNQTSIITIDSRGNKHIDVKQGDSTSKLMKNMIAILIKSIVANEKKKGDSFPEMLLIPDSNLVRKKFTSGLKNNNINVHVSWEQKTTNGITVDLKEPHSWSVAYISNYDPLLLKKITPQIGFSLLLFILCGGAFILSYTTIKKQQQLNLQKDDFISNMSHELKTPVATAKVAIEALQKFDGMEDAQKRRDYLDMAAWEMERLDRLVANVMNNVQMQNGTINLLKQDIDVNTLLEKLATTMQPLFAEKNKSLVYQSNVKDGILHVDAVHIQGAVYNILDNAIKYGGDSVIMDMKQEGNHLIISVSDNGQGIPEEYRQKVFEKFFRIPSGNVHDVKGYGLGLNYAHYVIKAHGGNIMQENSKEGGAIFIITLPMQP